MTQVYGTFIGRWYVTVLGVVFVWRATRHLGWRNTALYAVAAVGVGALAENASVHLGIPYTRYIFNPALRGKELFLGDVPLMVPLSYTFLGYFGFAAGRMLASGPYATRARRPWQEYLLGVLLTVWALWIMDPVSRLGQHWFLGRVFHYRGPGFWFGLPLASQAGFTATAAVLVGLLSWLTRREPDRRVARVRDHPHFLALITYASQLAWLSIVALVVGADTLGGSTMLVWVPAVAIIAVTWSNLRWKSQGASIGGDPTGQIDPQDAPHRLGEPAFFANHPDSSLARLRRESPVSWHDEDKFWALTRHRDIVEISRDPARFSSSRGVLMADRERAVSADDSLLYLDPPRHAHYRKLVNRAFTPRRVANLEPRIRQLTVRLLDRIEPNQPTNLVDALTAPLPLAVIAELLGLPSADLEDFRRWSEAIMEAASHVTDENAALSLELIAYLQDQLEDRRSNPRDDLLGVLMDADVGGERLGAAELVGFCMTLLVAGNETTRSMLTGGLVALAENPDQRRRLAAQPELIAAAVEEMLRWVTPIMAMARTTTCPVAVGDRVLAADEFVVMIYGAANRDEEVFGADAGRFDAFRSPNPHLAFGFGEHFCIGAGLARLEGRVVVSEVLARWPDYVVVGEVKTVPSTLVRQVSSVPVVFRP